MSEIFSVPDANPTQTPAPANLEASLKESEQRFRLLVENATNIAMFLIDASGRISSWNEGARRVLGYNEAEVLNQSVDLIFTPEDRASGVPARELATARREGRAADVRWHLRKEGTRFWADGIMERLTSETGAFEGYAKILRDATGEKQAEERERSRLVQIFDKAPAFMATLRGPQHVFEMTNAAYNQLIGHRKVIGRTVAQALPEVVLQGFVGILDGVYQTGTAFVAKDLSVMLQVNPDSPLSEVVVDLTYQPLFDEGGAVSGILVYGIDRTLFKQQEQQSRAATDALNLAQERYRTLIDSFDIGFCVIEMLYDEQGNPNDYRFVETNPAFEQHTGLFNSLGKTIREMVPGIDTSWSVIYGKVAATGETVRFENHDPAMNRSFDVYAQRIGQAGENKVGIFFTNVTARRQAQEALRQSEERLQDAQSRLESAMSAGNIATWTLDLTTNRLFPDKNFAPLFGVAPEYATEGDLDVYLNVIFPEDRAGMTAAIARAIAENVPYQAEYRVVRADGTIRWLSAHGTVERDAEGKAITMSGVIVDITERIEREKRERFLSDLTERTRALLNPEEILYETAKAVGEHTGAHRALYIEIDDDADTLTIRRDFVRSDLGIASIAGTLSLSSFGPPIVASLRAGDVTEVVDTETDTRLTPENRAVFRATQFQSFLAIPLHKAGRFVAILALHQAVPRVWTADEAELLTAVMERTWLAFETARLFRETQQRAEREALLNYIGTALLSTPNPESVLEAAISSLGEGLGVDRCYFVRYSLIRNKATVAPEWFRNDMGLEPLDGHIQPMSAYSVNRDPSFVAGRTSIVNDIKEFSPEEAAPLLSLNIRALLRVPIAIGDQMTALGVAMADKPRQWTQDEVRLVENVAALVRSALESAQVQQRERNIAQQLQDALQPSPPDDIPGLALASYYRPALAEASVGGDFFDVFPLGEGRTALVVADLSGKGLAAASQVATVRNMLRYALYSQPNLAQAVTNLHHILVERDVLTGFATLFVGVYDEKNHVLTYVNCGQEPGLVFRAATGRIEQMPPTGSVLGGFDTGDDHEARLVRLLEGDVIALFTDGLTEVGPSRKIQLEVDGVSAVLRNCCIGEPLETNTPQAVVECLIAGVDNFAGGGLRDDIALLVGVVKA